MMHVGRHGTILAVFAGAIVCAIAIAATSPLMALFDTNRDNRVSLVEYQSYLDKGFHRLDVNGDDVLETGEFPSGTHHHGPLTLADHHRQVARQFHRQDANHDGHLDRHELMAPPR